MNRPNADLTVTVATRTTVGDVAVLELTAEPPGPLPDWEPGAHIEVLVPDGGADEEMVRQYSLCGDAGASWRVAVLREPAGRGGSAWLHDHATPGARLEVAGPRNHFHFDADQADGRPVLFVAGGIGVTPLLPMATAAARAEVDYVFHLAGRDGQVPFLDEVTERHGDRLITHIAGLDPRLDVGALLGAASPDTIVYCCGPARLLDEVEREATRLGLDLHLERFEATAPSEPVWTGDFEVEFALSGVTATVPPDRSVLEVAEESGIFVLSSCQEGTCGTCETVVVEGDVDHRDSILTPAERADGNLMYVCVSRSAGPRLVVDL